MVPNENKFNNIKDCRNQIHEILLHQWDPIGIKNEPAAFDEYDIYISKIYEMIIAGKNCEEIASFLHWVETERMGLKGNIELAKNVAITLVHEIIGSN